MSIVTPRYLESEWCRREVLEFCQAALATGGLVVGNKSRLFKVTKTPVDPQKSEALLPPYMRDVLGFDFFNVKDEVPFEFDPAYGKEYEQLYNLSVAKLAWEIAQLINTLQPGERESNNDGEKAAEESYKPRRPTVYLAECSYDRKPQRELLEGELKRLGYPVLPDRPLPLDEVKYVATVESLLARCALSIHLIGEKYGAVPDGPTDQSAAMLQNELAVARHRAGDLRRLIWLPEKSHSEDGRQQRFIETLNTNALAQQGGDLITGDIEALREAIHSNLKALEQPKLKQPESGQGSAQRSGQLVYFICHEKDVKNSVPLRKICKQSGFEVALPAFEGSAGKVRESNRQNLIDCDVVFLFYGAGDSAWKRANDSELRKLAGYRNAKTRPHILTYLAAPRTRDKQDLIDMEELGLIDGLDGIAESATIKALRGWAKPESTS
jgi:hypothetical protein